MKNPENSCCNLSAIPLWILRYAQNDTPFGVESATGDTVPFQLTHYHQAKPVQTGGLFLLRSGIGQSGSSSMVE